MCVCVNEDMNDFKMCLSFVLIALLIYIQTDSNFICTFFNDISNCTLNQAVVNMVA